MVQQVDASLWVDLSALLKNLEPDKARHLVLFYLFWCVPEKQSSHERRLAVYFCVPLFFLYHYLRRFFS